MPESIESDQTEKRHRRFALNDKVLRFHMTSTVDTQKVRAKLKSKYILIFFLVLSIILTSVSVSGCVSASSTSSANNYLLEVRYDAYGLDKLTAAGVVNPDAYTTLNSNVANKSDLAVRISYFGTCTRSSAQASNNPQYPDWYCSRNVTELVGLIKTPTEDPFNAIFLMNSVRSSRISPAILIVSVCVTVIALVALLVADLQHARLYFISTFLVVFACFMGLVGMVWQQASVDTAAQTIQSLSNNSISTRAGQVPAGLGWTSIFILFCSGFGIVVLVMSERKTLSIFGDMDPNDVENLSGTNPLSDGGNNGSMRSVVPDVLSVNGSRSQLGGHPPYPITDSARIPRPYS